MTMASTQSATCIESNITKKRKYENVKVFENFKIKKILKDNAQTKIAFVHGEYGNKDGDAIAILEKTPFDKTQLEVILSRNTECEKIFSNDIYTNLLSFPQADINGIKTTLIYPASQKHLDKYIDQQLHVISETAKDYDDIVLPYIKTQAFGVQWVYNILDKKAESDRIVFEDTDENTGFLLLPDLKWDGKTKENLYLVGLCMRKDVGCLRDLNQSHLPLLNNMLTKGKRAICDKYGIEADELRVYVHYQPSYYHFHVHYTYIKYDGPGQQCDKAHVLANIINNITLYPDYYQRVTLTYVLKLNEGLYQLLSASSRKSD